MRRRIALLLTLMIILNSFSGLNCNVLKASDRDDFISKYKYALLDKGLSYSETDGVKEKNGSVPLDEDEGGVKWLFDKKGIYTLSYYLYNLGTTEKVTLEFEQESNGTITVTASNNKIASGEKFTVRKYNVTNSKWEDQKITADYDPITDPDRGPTTVAPGDDTYNGASLKLQDVLKLGQVSEDISFTDQQLSLVMGNVTINMLIDNKTIRVSTDGLEKGYITEFNLDYKIRYGSTGIGAALGILKDLRAFESKPMHLYRGGGLTDRALFTSDTENIASHPGVKVDIRLPQRVDPATKEFKPISGVKGTLEIYDSQESSRGKTLQFDMSGTSAPITDINGEEVGQTVVHNTTTTSVISIYLTQKIEDVDDSVADTVVEWSELKASRLINMSLELESDEMRRLGLNKPYKPSNQGYTYMEYSVSKIDQNTIQVDFKPYEVNAGQVVEYVFLRAATPTALREVGKKSLRQHDKKESYIIQNIGQGSYFKIEADLNGKGRNVNSQVFMFNSDNAIIPPSSPIITNINNVYAVPPKQEGQEHQAVGFDLEWRPNSNENLERSKQDILDLLQKGRLYYEVTFHTEPKSKRTDASSSKIIKIFEIEKDGENNLIVKNIKGEAGNGYYTSEGTFRVPNVIIKDVETGWQNFEYIKDGNVIHEERFQETDYDLSKFKDSHTTNGPKIPGTYYVSLRAILDPDNAENASQTLKYRDSSEKTITIDTTNEIIPVPNDIRAEDESNVVNGNNDIKYNIHMNRVDIERYVKSMLTPVGLGTVPNEVDKYQGNYEVYLYQSDKHNDFKNINSAIEKEENKARTKHIDLLDSKTLADPLNLTKEDLDHLRNGGVLPIEMKIDPLHVEAGRTDNIILPISNLDPNQVYYVVVRVRLDVYEPGVAEPEHRYSGFSSVSTFTTINNPQQPKPEDKVPTTPKNVAASIDEKSSTTAIVTWDKADITLDQDITKVYYEVLRSETQEVDEKQLYSTISIDDVISKNPSLDLVGFSTEGKFIKKKTKDSDWKELDPAQKGGDLSTFTLKDNSITSNKIYYYYVRTVCMIDGQIVRSSWIKVSITTEPVEGVKDVKIETVKDYNHNPKNEIVVSFDSNITIEALNKKDYQFEIAVRSEDEDEYSSTKYSSSLIKSLPPTGNRVGKTRYVYKISGLTPSKRYYIKIRVIDYTQKVSASEEPPKSLYSPAVSTRTDYDQETDDKNNKYEEYIKKFDQEVEKIKNKPYWTLDEGESYIYRKSYIVSDMNVVKEYELNVDGNDSTEFYLPADVFTEANENNVVLKVTIDGASVQIRPNTILETTPEVEEALSKINDGYVEDYYIGLRVSGKKVSEKINNEEPIGPQVTVSMTVVYMKKGEVVLESDCLMALQKIIDKEKEHFVSRLEKKVKNGTLKDSELTTLIDDSISKITSEHAKKVRNIVTKNIRKEVDIAKPDKALLILFKSDAYAANGYFYGNGGWISVDAYSALDGFAVEIMQFGRYIVTGQANLINTVPSLAPYQGFIAKYNLSDFFTIDSYYIKTAATKEQIYGAVARIMGAPRNTDYLTFLKGKNIKGVSNLTMKNPIRQDEAIYIVMQGYEKIKNRPIASIVIKNRQSVKNIGAFQNVYRDYVYAAVELKIVSNPNSQVLPSKQMTVEECIAMLSKMAS